MAEKSKVSSKGVMSKEVKAANFIRVATPRIEKALKCIHLLGNCAGVAYIYTDGQVTKMLNALRNAVTGLESRFAGKKDSATGFNWYST
jgi:hypothetical protein